MGPSNNLGMVESPERTSYPVQGQVLKGASSPIDQALTDLDMSIEGLMKKIDVLDMRLQPVIVPTPMNNLGANAERKEPTNTLSNKINSRGAAIRILSNRINHIIESLEL